LKSEDKKTFDCKVCHSPFYSQNQLSRHIRETNHFGDETNVFTPTGSIQIQPTFAAPLDYSRTVPVMGTQPGFSLQHSEQPGSRYISDRSDHFSITTTSNSNSNTSTWIHTQSSRPEVSISRDKQISRMAKCFLIISKAFSEGKIDITHKSQLKDLLITGQSETMYAAVEAFEVNNDWNDLIETFVQISLSTRHNNKIPRVA